MQQAIRFFLSPAAFAIGFLWPLVAQVIGYFEWMAPSWQMWLVAALLVAPFAVMAQWRGSWIWIK